MSTFVRVVIGLLVTLPLLAYAAGSLVASSADPSAPPSPIAVPAEGLNEKDRQDGRSGSDRPAREDPRNRGGPGQHDDEPEVVLPEPDTVDDDDSDDSDSRSGDDD